MKLGIRWIFAIAVIILVSPVAQSQVALTISVRTNQEPGAKDASILLRSTIRNDSGETLRFSPELSTLVIEIRTSSGSVVPKTAQQVRTEEQLRRRPRIRRVPVEIPPGETHTWSFPISEMYEMRATGQYSVTASLMYEGQRITSNVVPVDVSAPAEAASAVAKPQQPFSLAIETDQEEVKTGGKVAVTVALTNQTAASIQVTNAWTEYSLDVRGPDGNPAPLTAEGIKLRNNYGHSGGNVLVVAPGEKKSMGLIRIDQLFEMSQPGEYMIQVGRGENESLVKSNTLNVTVKN